MKTSTIHFSCLARVYSNKPPNKSTLGKTSRVPFDSMIYPGEARELRISLLVVLLCYYSTLIIIIDTRFFAQKKIFFRRPISQEQRLMTAFVESVTRRLTIASVSAELTSSSLLNSFDNKPQFFFCRRQRKISPL